MTTDGPVSISEPEPGENALGRAAARGRAFTKPPRRRVAHQARAAVPAENYLRWDFARRVLALTFRSRTRQETATPPQPFRGPRCANGRFLESDKSRRGPRRHRQPQAVTYLRLWRGRGRTRRRTGLGARCGKIAAELERNERTIVAGSLASRASSRYRRVLHPSTEPRPVDAPRATFNAILAAI